MGSHLLPPYFPTNRLRLTLFYRFIHYPLVLGFIYLYNFRLLKFGRKESDANYHAKNKNLWTGLYFEAFEFQILHLNPISKISSLSHLFLHKRGHRGQFMILGFLENLKSSFKSDARSLNINGNSLHPTIKNLTLSHLKWVLQ